MKLGLGTVQFGTNYGVSNNLGQTTSVEVEKILEFAATQGIGYLDTAPAYGNSESVLGEHLRAYHQFRIITKIDRIHQAKLPAKDVKDTIERFSDSLQRLKQQSVYGLLVHHPDDLLNDGGDRLMNDLNLIKTQGMVKKVGVSVYSSAQIDAILAKYTIDIIQLPLNVFDRRLIDQGYLKLLKSLDIEIHVRSVFLQGLLLMDEEELPPYLSDLAPYLRRYHQSNQAQGYSNLQAALGFVNQLSEVDAMIVGVNNLSQLQQIALALDDSFSADYLTSLGVDNERLINPSLWGK